MINRSKILAAALGLVIATGAIGGASAQTNAPAGTAKPVLAQSVPSKTIASKPVAGKIATGKHHRIHLAHRGTKHLTLAHRATSRAKVAHKLGLRHVAKDKIKGKTTIVR